MAEKTIVFRSWPGVKVEPMRKELWSSGARRGTVIVEMQDKKAVALLVDDAGGIRESLSLEVDKVDELIGAAARTWLERGALGSFAVVANLRDRGDIGPRPGPVPGPGPVGDGLIRALSSLVHGQLRGLSEAVEIIGAIEQLK